MTLEQVIEALVLERLQRGWTYRDLAQRMAATRASGSTHASHSIICEYEHGNRRPTVVALQAWANALDFELDFELRRNAESSMD